MLYEIRQKLADIFDQVSVPLYHEGEGPFFMATREQYGDVTFFFYEFSDVEKFLKSFWQIRNKCLQRFQKRIFCSVQQIIWI